MRICLVNAFFHPYIGGTEKHMYELGRRLARKEEVHALTCLLEDTKAEENVKGVHVHRIPARFIKAPLIYPPPLVFAPGVKDAVTLLDGEYDFDIFHLHGRWFTDFAYVAKYAKKNGKKFCLTLHNARPLGISPMVGALGTMFDWFSGVRTIKAADRIVAVSASVKEDISHYRGVDRDKIEVIHNGVDIEVFKPSKPILRDKYAEGFDNVFLFLGRLIEQKGLPYLIDATKEVIKDYPSTRLLVVGRGKLKGALEARVRKEGLQKHIVFPGFVDEKTLPSLYSSCDAYVLPSLWEVLPISLLEALSCGAPLIASDAGGNPEVVENGVNGFIFEKRNTNQLAEEMKTLANDPALRKRMARKSREIAVKKFDWDIIAQKTIRFYNKVLD
jgi:glycosyltransferase involved in cell wall biosynthesis